MPGYAHAACVVKDRLYCACIEQLALVILDKVTLVVLMELKTDDRNDKVLKMFEITQEAKVYVVAAKRTEVKIIENDTLETIIECALTETVPKHIETEISEKLGNDFG